MSESTSGIEAGSAGDVRKPGSLTAARSCASCGWDYSHQPPEIVRCTRCREPLPGTSDREWIYPELPERDGDRIRELSETMALRLIDLEVDGPNDWVWMHGVICAASKRLGYPATPVDCLISELRDLFDTTYENVITREIFEKRVAQFEEEIGRA